MSYLILKTTTRGQRDWPADFPHDNGQYINNCSVCGREFTGHGRRVVCRACTAEPPVPVTGAFAAVLDERARQASLGYTAEYDREHNTDGDLERGMSSYALIAAVGARKWAHSVAKAMRAITNRLWPFRAPLNHTTPHRDALVTATALGLAAIERLDWKNDPNPDWCVGCTPDNCIGCGQGYGKYGRPAGPLPDDETPFSAPGDE